MTLISGGPDSDEEPTAAECPAAAMDLPAPAEDVALPVPTESVAPHVPVEDVALSNPTSSGSLAAPGTLAAARRNLIGSLTAAAAEAAPIAAQRSASAENPEAVDIPWKTRPRPTAEQTAAGGRKLEQHANILRQDALDGQFTLRVRRGFILEDLSGITENEHFMYSFVVTVWHFFGNCITRYFFFI